MEKSIQMSMIKIKVNKFGYFKKQLQILCISFGKIVTLQLILPLGAETIKERHRDCCGNIHD